MTPAGSIDEPAMRRNLVLDALRAEEDAWGLAAEPDAGHLLALFWVQADPPTIPVSTRRPSWRRARPWMGSPTR